jgi:hypothetical protein
MGLAFDPKPDNVAVAQLVHLHAQLGAKLQANRRERARLAADMKHVEAVSGCSIRPSTPAGLL